MVLDLGCFTHFNNNIITQTKGRLLKALVPSVKNRGKRLCLGSSTILDQVLPDTCAIPAHHPRFVSDLHFPNTQRPFTQRTAANPPYHRTNTPRNVEAAQHSAAIATEAKPLPTTEKPPICAQCSGDVNDQQRKQAFRQKGRDPLARDESASTTPSRATACLIGHSVHMGRSRYDASKPHPQRLVLYRTRTHHLWVSWKKPPSCCPSPNNPFTLEAGFMIPKPMFKTRNLHTPTPSTALSLLYVHPSTYTHAQPLPPSFHAVLKHGGAPTCGRRLYGIGLPLVPGHGRAGVGRPPKVLGEKKSLKGQPLPLPQCGYRCGSALHGAGGGWVLAMEGWGREVCFGVVCVICA